MTVQLQKALQNVWHNALPVKLSDSIERVQKRALRIIFPALHYQEALATTGCVSLHTRRMELCSKLFTKIKEPESRLRHLVPPTRSQALGSAAPFETKTDHLLQVTKLNALNEAFLRRCAFMPMACNLGNYGNLMYNLIVSSFLSHLLYYIFP